MSESRITRAQADLLTHLKKQLSNEDPEIVQQAQKDLLKLVLADLDTKARIREAEARHALAVPASIPVQVSAPVSAPAATSAPATLSREALIADLQASVEKRKETHAT